MLETRAPDAQRLDDGTSRPVTGVQLLAEPIRFRVAAAADAGSQAPGGTSGLVVEGQVDIFQPPANTGFIDRCAVEADASRPTACVNPAGSLMVVKDPGLLPLPFTGAIAPWLLGIGGLAGLGLLIAGVFFWRGRSSVAVASSASAHSSD